MQKKETKTTTAKTTSNAKSTVADSTVKAKAAPAEKGKKATAAKKAETKPTAVKAAKKEKVAAPKEAVKAVKEKAVPATAEKAASAKTNEDKKTAKKAVKKTAVKATKTTTAKTAATPKKPVASKAETTTAVKTAKASTAKTTAVKAESTAPKPKKAAASKAQKEKMAYYESLSVEDCIRFMQNMNVQYQYEDYYRLLLDEADMKKVTKNIIDGNNITAKKYDFAKDGFDQDLVAVTLKKVGDTMDMKAADFKTIKKAMKQAIAYQMDDDAEKNAAAYLEAFQTAEKLLMLGQRKNITSAQEISAIIDQDVAVFYEHFFQFAYDLLPSWQYSDVKFYEDFAYAVLSQYSDLFEAQQLRIQMDAADLYIKHGDYMHGDEMYGYILRDNQIKDYIYYRYASSYQDIDRNKAKAIAYSSLQYVDDRYTYYPNIMDIVNHD